MAYPNTTLQRLGSLPRVLKNLLDEKEVPLTPNARCTRIKLPVELKAILENIQAFTNNASSELVGKSWIEWWVFV